MKKILFFAVFVCLTVILQAQSNEKILRSTISMAGSSRSVQSGEIAFIVQQSIGQSGPIGVMSGDSYVARQGFIQPFQMLSYNRVKELEASIFPNPMKPGERLSVRFEGEVETDIQISVLDILGNRVESFVFPAMQDLVLDLDHLNPGGYLIQISANDAVMLLKMLKRSDD